MKIPEIIAAKAPRWTYRLLTEDIKQLYEPKVIGTKELRISSYECCIAGEARLFRDVDQLCRDCKEHAFALFQDISRRSESSLQDDLELFAEHLKECHKDDSYESKE